MQLAAYQNFLAQLYTNKNLRDEFLLDAVGFGEKYGIDAATALAIADLPLLDFFSNTLIYKRLGMVRELLPQTADILGERFSRFYLLYAATHELFGKKRYINDAMQFCHYLLKNADLTAIEREVIQIDYLIKKQYLATNFFVFRKNNWKIIHQSNKNTVWICVKIFSSVIFEKQFIF